MRVFLSAITWAIRDSARMRAIDRTKPVEGKDKIGERRLSGVLDALITSLAELLEEKGVITQEEWEQRIKKNLKA
jgi:hypothetical protein